MNLAKYWITYLLIRMKRVTQDYKQLSKLKQYIYLV